MTDRLISNWDLDGFVDEQRYYCSTLPIDTNNPPPPKYVLDGDARSCIDTDISQGFTYHIRISSMRNGVEKFSEEKTVFVPQESQYDKVYYVGELPNISRAAIFREIVESLGEEMVGIEWQNVASIPNDCKLILAPDMTVGDGYFHPTYLTSLMSKFNAGIPVLISANAGYPGQLPETFPSNLGIASKFADISASNSIDVVENIMLPAPYSTAQSNLVIKQSSYYISGLSSVAANAHIFARKGSVCAGAILLKDAINKNGVPSPANVAFAGFAFTNPPSQLLNGTGKDLLKEVIMRTMR